MSSPRQPDSLSRDAGTALPASLRYARLTQPLIAGVGTSRNDTWWEEEQMKYVGLTDDPGQRKIAHGNPSDWWQRYFSTEKEARDWERDMVAKPGYTGGGGGEGWHYGYTYIITASTKQ
ncbi:MAG: hypothetical protein V1694_03570 [Candidatus Eisenbacteria bacterium]